MTWEGNKWWSFPYAIYVGRVGGAHRVWVQNKESEDYPTDPWTALPLWWTGTMTIKDPGS